MIWAQKGKASLQIPPPFLRVFFGAAWLPWGISNNQKTEPIFVAAWNFWVMFHRSKTWILLRTCLQKVPKYHPKWCFDDNLPIVNSEKSPTKKNTSKRKTTLNIGGKGAFRKLTARFHQPFFKTPSVWRAPLEWVQKKNWWVFTGSGFWLGGALL